MSNPFSIGDVEKDVEASSSRVKHRKQKALEISLHEGSASSASASFGTSYITPFALALNSTAFQVGLLSSISGLAAPIAQFFGSKLMEHRSRKKLVLTFVFLESIMWIPILLLGYLFWKNMFQGYLPYALITLYSILVIFGGLAYPAWFSWMGDLVPTQDRGKYFSKRNLVTGSIGLAAVLVAAFLLDAFKTRGLILWGFTVLFAAAFSLRFLSFMLFKKQYSPSFRLNKGYYFSMFSFLKRYDNFGKFSVFRAAFYLALMIASPFFTVYMIKDLHFSYVTFMAVTASGSLFYLIFSPIVGKFSDRFGNVKLMYIGTALFAITPLLWLISSKPIYLIAIPQLVSGLGNATLIIGFNNFIYDSVSPQKRGICSAYSNILVGIGTFIGGIIGGIMINYTYPSFLNPFIFIFIISSALRFSTILLLIGIKDERPVESLPPARINIAHPFRSLNAEIAWFRSVLR